MKNNWKTWGIVMIVLSVIPLFMGFYKMFAYSESYPPVNAYVGGDAYNFIINSNYATGFFVLTVGLLIAGLVCMLIGVNVEKLEEVKMQTQALKEINFRVKDIRDYQEPKELESEEDPSI